MTMRKNGFDQSITKSVIKLLDAAARKHGLKDVKHGAAKWVQGQTAKVRLAKQQKALEQELARVNAKLAR